MVYAALVTALLAYPGGVARASMVSVAEMVMGPVYSTADGLPFAK
jgi:hypothetical protein